jgi:hypothetical protein
VTVLSVREVLQRAHRIEGAPFAACAFWCTANGRCSHLDCALSDYPHLSRRPLPGLGRIPRPITFHCHRDLSSRAARVAMSYFRYRNRRGQQTLRLVPRAFAAAHRRERLVTNDQSC